MILSKGTEFGDNPTVRQLVAQGTREAHERLHVHPAIGRLTDPSVSLAEYHIALHAFRMVFHSVEKQRRAVNVWNDLSIEAHCQRLDQDCPGEPRVAHVELGSATSLLGALYAVHGSQFGGSLIRRNLVVALPSAPLAYFSMTNDPARWRNLVAHLERFRDSRADIAEIIHGANAVFRHIEREATRLQRCSPSGSPCGHNLQASGKG